MPFHTVLFDYVTFFLPALPILPRALLQLRGLTTRPRERADEANRLQRPRSPRSGTPDSRSRISENARPEPILMFKGETTHGRRGPVECLDPGFLTERILASNGRVDEQLAWAHSKAEKPQGMTGVRPETAKAVDTLCNTGRRAQSLLVILAMRCSSFPQGSGISRRVGRIFVKEQI